MVAFLACQSNTETAEMSRKVVQALTLMPEQTNLLVYVNVASLQESQFGQEVRHQIDAGITDKENQDYREVMEATGLDVEKDVSEVWLAGIADSDNETKGGALVRGTFDRGRITDYLNKNPEKFHRSAYKGHTLYVLGSADDNKALLLYDDETILTGDNAWLNLVLDNQDQKAANVLQNTVMAQCIDALPYKNHLWAVLNLKELSGKWAEKIRDQGNVFKGSKSVENMETIVFATRLNQSADVYIQGTFKTAEEAEMLGDMLKGFKSMAKLMVSDDKDAIDMLNEIDIRAEGRELRITTELQRDFIEKVQQKRRTFAQGEGKMMF
jgi:hypothetical protein